MFQIGRNSISWNIQSLYINSKCPSRNYKVYIRIQRLHKSFGIFESTCVTGKTMMKKMAVHSYPDVLKWYRILVHIIRDIMYVSIKIPDEVLLVCMHQLVCTYPIVYMHPITCMQLLVCTYQIVCRHQ